MAIDTGRDLRDLIAARGVAAAARAVEDGEGPPGVVLAARRERRDASTAVFSLGDRRLAAVEPRGRPEALETWWLPGDPRLPGLPLVTRLAAEPDLWTPVPGAGPGPLAGLRPREVAYRPGQRAVFVLEDAAGTPRRVLRVVPAEEFGEAAARAVALARAGVASRVPMPVVGAVAGGPRAMLTSYVPGDPVSALAPDGRAALVGRIAAAAAAVHGVPPAGLPAWTPEMDLSRASGIVAQAAQAMPDRGSRREVGATLDAVARGIAAGGRWRPRLVHGDLSLRNAVVDPAGRIGLIDWDRACAGPVERDLATLSSGVRALMPAGAVAALYREAGGPDLDPRLVDRLIALQRLLGLCRRIVAGMPDDAIAQEARGIRDLAV